MSQLKLHQVERLQGEKIMRIAITGAAGFVGTHLTQRLESEGHELVLISRRSRKEEPRLIANDLSDVSVLRESFRGCKAVAHCAGINREIGNQTYRRVHIEGTRNVVEAARAAGVEKIVLMSFLRARANCGSPYHESKWEAEEIVRNSELDYTIIKAGVIYGLGDHMLDHLSQALYTFPVFATVGLKEKSVRPLAVEDLVHVMRAALIDRRMKRQTIALLGPEEIYLSEAVRRVAEVVGRHPLMFPLPVFCHRLMAQIFELTMKVPLTSLAQVRILSEGVVTPGSRVASIPYDLVPTRRFTAEQIRSGLPQPKPFCVGDLRWCS
jgi:NADH dehydrogenase